jgi:hypothetical protein
MFDTIAQCADVIHPLPAITRTVGENLEKLAREVERPARQRDAFPRRTETSQLSHVDVKSPRAHSTRCSFGKRNQPRTTSCPHRVRRRFCQHECRFAAESGAVARKPPVILLAPRLLRHRWQPAVNVRDGLQQSVAAMAKWGQTSFRVRALPPRTARQSVRRDPLTTNRSLRWCRARAPTDAVCVLSCWSC